MKSVQHPIQTFFKTMVGIDFFINAVNYLMQGNSRAKIQLPFT